MAVRTLADVEIFNQALLRLGQTTYFVSAVDGSDTTKFGKLAYPLYFMTRNEELRSGSWKVAVKRAQLSPANSTQTCTWGSGTNVMTVADSTKITVGWLVTATIIQGGGTITTPTGIPANTTVLSITDATHIVLSANTTAAGTAQSVVFQVNNLTGYWYAYTAPNDILHARSIAAIFPNFVYLWPFKVQHALKFTYIYEAGYFYTDLDPNNGNPIIEYIVELTSAPSYWTVTTVSGNTTITLTAGTAAQSNVGSLVTGTGIPVGTTIQSFTDSTHVVLSAAATASASGIAVTVNPQTTFDFDFAEALINRLAMKLSRAVTMSDAVKKDVSQDYLQTVVRAANNNAKEASDLQKGDPWWTDRRR